MIDLEIQLVRQNPACLRVLQAYQTALAQLREQAGESQAMTSEDESASNDDSDEVDSTVADGEDGAEHKKRRAPTWITRLAGVDGVDDEELSWVHGQLIAYGLLKCDLRDRSAGVVYQLTPEGRQVLEAELDESLSEAA